MKIKWTTDRPTEPGEYWVSLSPMRRPCGSDSVSSVRVKRRSAYDSELMADTQGSVWRHPVDHRIYDGAKWSRREIPADPFQEVKA